MSQALGAAVRVGMFAPVVLQRRFSSCVCTAHCSTFLIFDASSQFSPLMAIIRRPKVKTATLTVRLDPKIKAAAEAAAEFERRSVTNFLEVLIVNHCLTLGFDPELFAKEPRE